MSSFNDSFKVSRLWRGLQAGTAKSWSLNILGLVQVKQKKKKNKKNSEANEPCNKNAVISQQCTPCSRISGDTVRISYSYWGTTVLLFFL